MIMEDNGNYRFLLDGREFVFPKHPEDAEKFIVLCCAKNENDYIEEYVSHYMSYGFDKVIICDNNDDDSLEGVLKDRVSRGEVEIYDFRGVGSFQVQFYTYFCTEGNYKWCAYYDCDEFLELNCYSNIKDFVATLPDDCDCVSFNWMVYGSNGQIVRRKGNVQDRFRIPVYPLPLFKENMFVKSMLKGGSNRFENVSFNGSHMPMSSNRTKILIGGYHEIVHDGGYQSHTYFPPRYKCGHLNHYYTKSYEEWKAKASRGWPDGTDTLVDDNYKLCENGQEYPIGLFDTALFIKEDYLKNIVERCGWQEVVDKYDVIEFACPAKQVYGFVSQAVSLMALTKGHTFIFTDDIDDTLFNIFVEAGMNTGNRAVFARDRAEVWNCYLKYSDHSAGTYYIITFS